MLIHLFPWKPFLQRIRESQGQLYSSVFVSYDGFRNLFVVQPSSSRPPRDTLIYVLQSERIKQDQTSLCEDWRTPLISSPSYCLETPTKMPSLCTPWTLRTSAFHLTNRLSLLKETRGMALYTKMQQEELRFLGIIAFQIFQQDISSASFQPCCSKKRESQA